MTKENLTCVYIDICRMPWSLLSKGNILFERYSINTSKCARSRAIMLLARGRAFPVLQKTCFLRVP